jgi:hypothetical protein
MAINSAILNIHNACYRVNKVHYAAYWRVIFVKGYKVSIMSIVIASLLIYGMGPALAGNALPDEGGMWSGQQGSQGQLGTHQGPPYERLYGNNDTVNNRQAGHENTNMPQVDFSGSPYGEWQDWASTYQSGPKYPYVFNFTGIDGTAGKNASTNAQKWFNGSWDNSRSGISKKIARQRIQTLLREMDMLKTMVNGSGISSEERARMADCIDGTLLWLENADKEIQAAGDMKSLGQAVARAEPDMAVIRSEIKANAGLLACKNMEDRFVQAINASGMIDERIQSPDLTAEDKEWLVQELSAYDQHVYNACQYHANARSSFERFFDARDDTYYIEGLKQIELAQDEMDRAYATLNGIFRRI